MNSDQWLVDEALCGLYRLHRDGSSTCATALVDRGRSRAEQMDALAHIDWAPPDQLSAVFENTTGGTMPPPLLDPALPADRCVSPFLLRYGTFIDTEDETARHPVRDYLWPVLNSDGDLVVEPEEVILAQWQSSKASEEYKPPKGDASLREYPDVERAKITLTTCRTVFHGRYHEPTAARDDYSMKLAMFSSALDDLRASVRQVRRWSARRHLWWALHVRHEWLDLFGITSVPSGGRLTNRDNAKRSLFLGFHTPGGPEIKISLPLNSQEIESDAVFTTYSNLLSGHPGRTCSTPQESEHQIRAGLFTSKTVTERLTTCNVSGSVPYSLPNSFGG